MMGMAQGKWAIELRPVDDSRTIPCISFAVTVGQKITVSWKADDTYTTRYIMRTLTAVLDNGNTYQMYTPYSIGISGEDTYTVTTAGNIVFGGYTVGLGTTCLIGDYIKINIENPTE